MLMLMLDVNRPIEVQLLVTVRNSSCVKVIFHRHLSFCSHGGVCIPACTGADTPPGRQPPPPRTATAADGTHPTGMHSWLSLSSDYT